MHEAQGVFCKTGKLWINSKIVPRKKILKGPDLSSPTVGGGAVVRLTMGLAQLGGDVEVGKRLGPNLTATWRGRYRGSTRGAPGSSSKQRRSARREETRRRQRTWRGGGRERGPRRTWRIPVAAITEVLWLFPASGSRTSSAWSAGARRRRTGRCCVHLRVGTGRRMARLGGSRHGKRQRGKLSRWAPALAR